jgi:hypothetical protein
VVVIVVMITRVVRSELAMGPGLYLGRVILNRLKMIRTDRYVYEEGPRWTLNSNTADMS